MFFYSDKIEYLIDLYMIEVYSIELIPDIVWFYLPNRNYI